MIRRIAYASLARGDLAASEVPRIIACSRANNQRAGIGGALVYTGTDFLQVIEGPAPVVALLWERVRRDPRHHSIGKFLDDNVAWTWYPEWQVGYLYDDRLVRRIGDWREQRFAPDEDVAQGLRSLLRQSDPT